MKKDKLKHCLCGDMPIITAKDIAKSFRVECISCGCSEDEKPAIDEAVDVWNLKRHGGNE